MVSARVNHSAYALPDDQVIILGGNDPEIFACHDRRIELYDSLQEKSEVIAVVPISCDIVNTLKHANLGNNRFMIHALIGESNVIFDLKSRTFTKAAPLPLRNENIIELYSELSAPVMGARYNDSAIHVYLQETNEWKTFEHPKGNAFNWGVQLNSGKVLRYGDGPNASVFDPVSGQWEDLPPPPVYLGFHYPSTLTDNLVLFHSGYVDSVGYLFDLKESKWERGTGRAVNWYANAIRLSDHELIVVGGFGFWEGSGASTLSSTLLFNAETKLWSDGPSLRTDRASNALVRLSNGDVLTLGGRRKIPEAR